MVKLLTWLLGVLVLLGPSLASRGQIVQGVREFPAQDISKIQIENMSGRVRVIEKGAPVVKVSWSRRPEQTCKLNIDCKVGAGTLKIESVSWNLDELRACLKTKRDDELEAYVGKTVGQVMADVGRPERVVLYMGLHGSTVQS